MKTFFDFYLEAWKTVSDMWFSIYDSNRRMFFLPYELLFKKEKEEGEKEKEEKLVPESVPELLFGGKFDHVNGGEFIVEEVLVKVGVSADHLHISEKLAKKLGVKKLEKDLKAGKKGNLGQKGEFASTSFLEIIGPSGVKKKRRILGPFRKFKDGAQVQIELAWTTWLKLGIETEIRDSGALAGTPGCILRNPETGIEVEVDAGGICAKEHFHVRRKYAELLKLKNRQKVNVRIGGERDLTFNNVIVRVSKEEDNESVSEFHIDVEQANAAGIGIPNDAIVEKVQTIIEGRVGHLILPVPVRVDITNSLPVINKAVVN